MTHAKHIALATLASALQLATPLAAQRTQGERLDPNDPGVIATGQRITPVGVQTVFRGRVGGVRFGRRPDELWVAAPGAVQRLDWRRGRVVARFPFSGRPGVHGVAIDPANGRALVSIVGALPKAMATSRLPGTPLLAPNAIARLLALAPDVEGDSAHAALGTPALGDYMAGAPAIAARVGASGKRVAVVPLPANDALAVVDADAGPLLRTVPLGVAPVAAVVSADGATAWVSEFGGAKPKKGERAAPQCCDPRAEPVRIDARGLAQRGTVARIDVTAGRVSKTIEVGHHPTAVVWDTTRARLFVADGNDDAVSVIDTRTDAVIATLAVAPFRERRPGLAPTALALSLDARRLYVALGGANAVAVYDVADDAKSWTLAGLIPTGWYPSSLDVSADGRQLAVGTLLGIGSGEGRAGGSPGKRARYVHAVRGSVHVLDLPGDAQLAAWTTAAAENFGLTLASAPARAEAPRTVVPRAVPERPGEPSLVKHVVFVVKENRTYDQVLGDLGRGDGDTSLVIFGRDVTPNTHALAERYVTLDRFFASGGNSADGHNWITQANETAYPMWPLYTGRSYPSEGIDPLTYASGGFLWESAQQKGHRVSVFGEYAPAPKDSAATFRARLMASWRAHGIGDTSAWRDTLARYYRTKSDIPSLDRALVREYPGWTQDVPDVIKAADVLAHLNDWERAKRMPELVMIILPSDHTVGTSAGGCTPRACVADNDLALGMLVEGFTRSSFWKDMAILVVEDDAQDGVDHVDGHRTVALAISPYARRGVVDSTVYTQPSMVKTIELMLGLPAMSLFDLVATDMRASFIGAGETPDLTPYTALVPAVPLDETNRRIGAIIGPDAVARRRAALASARMRFDIPDAAPSDALNRILWHDARGWKTPYPGVKNALFFPLAVDLDDDEREEKGESRQREERREKAERRERGEKGERDR